MLYIICVIFIVSAFLGSKLFDKVIKGEHPSKKMAAPHGILNGIGIVLLIIYISFTEDVSAVLPFAFLLLAAAFGSVMFVRDIMEVNIPKWLAYVHAILATSGLLILIFLAFLG